MLQLVGRVAKSTTNAQQVGKLRGNVCNGFGT